MSGARFWRACMNPEDTLSRALRAILSALRRLQVVCCFVLCRLLTTSLFGDLAAGLYEDPSARLLEHPALLRLLNLAPIPPCGSVPPVSLICPVEVPGIAVLLH